MINKKEIEEQLKFKPDIKNSTEFSGFKRFIACGMGGSGLPARAVFFLDPSLPLWLHSDFYLPEKIEEDTLLIAISYSGNTRETLSFAKEAVKRGLPLSIIASGGKLLNLARENNLPFVAVPGGLQPRNAILYMLKSLLLILDEKDLMEELEKYQMDLRKLESQGEKLSRELVGSIPLVYSSRGNFPLAYIWKIVFNETAKLPAFANYFPELTHNEMQGIISNQSIKVLMIKDEDDNQGVREEMSVFEKVGDKNGVKINVTNLGGSGVTKLVDSWITARVVSYKIAEINGVEADKVPFIEAFKKDLPQ